jgi:tetratricopeptide (TPR) repeat protein
MDTLRKEFSPVRPIAARLLVALALAVLAGCATGGKAKTEPLSAAVVQAPVQEAKPTPPQAGTSVARLTDGREGFVITEPSSMDAESLADFERAFALMKDAQYEKAIELLEKVIPKSPGVTAPHINIAIAYNRTGKMEQAEQHLKAALALVPEHPVASNEYGLLLRKAGRFAEGRAVYEKALAAFPEYHPIHRNLAILCDIYLKDWACAQKHFESYSKAVPKDEQVKLWLADLTARQGR